jgi:poly(3-hydroxybutyrate) depolymerase
VVLALAFGMPLLAQTPAGADATTQPAAGTPVNAPAVTELVDRDGMTAWLYTPTEKPDPAKTYWLVVGAHGMGDTGKGACTADKLVSEFDDVIVLGPSFESMPPRDAAQPDGLKDGTTQPATQPATRPGWSMRADAYQMSGPKHEAKLIALIAEVGKTWKLHPKIVVYGFSAGAQFAHRFGMHHPDLVAGVSAHSAGTWAGLSGNNAINPAAREVRFAISCGEADNAPRKPAGTPTRIEGARQFAADLQSLGFRVQFQSWPGVQHEISPGVVPMTKELVDQVRADDR